MKFQTPNPSTDSGQAPKSPTFRYRVFFQMCVVTSALCFFLASCSKKKVEIPAGVLSKEQMVPVIVDVHLAQAGVVVRNPEDTMHYTFNDYLPIILDIHHITREAYDSSISFYTSHPELMKEIYDSVINELSKKEAEVQTNRPLVK